MGVRLGDALVMIRGDTSQYESDVEGAEAKTEGLLGKLAGAGKGLLTGALVAGGAAIAGGLAFLASSVGEASEAQQGLAGLDNALSNLGENAPMTKAALVDLADSIQANTRFSDDSIIAAEDLLLRFGTLGKEVFPRTMTAAADMAAAMKTDVTSAAEQLGRALSNPAEAAGRLARSGIILTDEQQKLIDTMMEAGDVAGAQGVILGVVEGKFKGAAEAAGNTFAGQMDKLNNQFANIKEQIGMAVLPALQVLAGWLQKALADPRVQAAIASLVSWLSTAIPQAIGFAVQAVTWLADQWATWGPTVIGVLTTVWNTITTVFNAVLGFIQTNMGTIQTTFSGVWTMIQSIIEIAWSIISGIVETAMLVFQGDWAGAWERVKTMFSDVWEGIKSYFTGWWDTLTGVFSLVWAAFGGSLQKSFEDIKAWFSKAWDDTLAWFKGIPQTFADVGTAIINAILDAMKGAWNSVVDWLKTQLAAIWDQIKAAVGIPTGGSAPEQSTGSTRGTQSVGAGAGQGIAPGGLVFNFYNYGPIYANTPAQAEARGADMAYGLRMSLKEAGVQ